MTTPPTIRSRKRSKQEEVTDDGKLIIICFYEHVETFKIM